METWQAGKDRNERDDTVYFGERGQFRGFLASQEGWLTDGESGVTGVSIDRIFEFPREKKKRRRREPRLSLRYDREYPRSELAVPHITSNFRSASGRTGPITGYLERNRGAAAGFDPQDPPYLRSPRISSPAVGFSGNAFVRALGPAGDAGTGETAAQTSAGTKFEESPPTDAQAARWALQGNGATDIAEQGELEVPGGATEECRALGYRRATGLRWWYQDTDGDGTVDRFFTADLDSRPTHYQYKAYRVILYEATCRK